MNNNLRLPAALVVVFGVTSLVVGITVMGVAYTKQVWMTESMKQEKVELASLGVKDVAPGTIIASAEQAQLAADTVRSHRHSIAPTYSDLMAGGKYDPTNVKHLTYAQALNLENYLYLGVLGFGVVQLAMGVGAFMTLTGLALCLIGYTLLVQARALKNG
jgi:hypothetical protein